ncbi:hypothetical protein AWI08_23595 [Klebsiella aerogenes]|nr:hypothetical protein AWI08_23595 [Klebsiella aerogenes]
MCLWLDFPALFMDSDFLLPKFKCRSVCTKQNHFHTKVVAIEIDTSLPSAGSQNMMVKMRNHDDKPIHLLKTVWISQVCRKMHLYYRM